MTKNNEEKAINFLFDCKKCKLKSKEECLIYERCYKANEYICNLNKNLKVKEQECEELKRQLEEESKLGHKAVQEEADTFFDLLKVQKELDKLKQTLAEIKEIAEDTKDKFYDAIHTGGLYDRLEQIIRKINEVEDDRT